MLTDTDVVKFCNTKGLPVKLAPKLKREFLKAKACVSLSEDYMLQQALLNDSFAQVLIRRATQQ